MRTLALLLVGCSGQSGEFDLPGCEPVLTPVSTADATLGFSAADVAAFLADHLPTGVDWGGMTQGDASTDLALTVTLEGAPSLAEPGGSTQSCAEPTTWLRVPVAMHVTVAGGDVVAEGVATLDVGALDPARVRIDTGWNLPAELSGAYATAFAEFFDEEYGSSGYTLDGTWLIIHGPWAEPVFAIELQGTKPDAGLSAVAWRGHWTFPE